MRILAKALYGDFIFPPVKTGGYLINYKNFATLLLCEIKSLYNTLKKTLHGFSRSLGIAQPDKTIQKNLVPLSLCGKKAKQEFAGSNNVMSRIPR